MNTQNRIRDSMDDTTHEGGGTSGQTEKKP